MSPENWCLEDVFPIEIFPFQWDTRSFSGVFFIFTSPNFGVETAKDLGFLYPDLCSTDALQSGQIGFIVVGAKVWWVVWWGLGGGSSQFDIFTWDKIW